MLTDEYSFNNEIIFYSPLFARGRRTTARLDDCQSHNNGRVIERELLSRILEKLHVLHVSKGIVVELISLFKNNCLKTLGGFIDPRNFFTSKNFPSYGTFCCINRAIYTFSLFLKNLPLNFSPVIKYNIIRRNDCCQHRDISWVVHQ